MARLEIAAVCTPGLEPVCETELKGIGLRARTVSAGVIEAKTTTRQLYSAALWSRTASSLLVRVARFRATDFNFLETRAKEIDWSEWLPTGVKPEFRVTARKSALFHTEAIAERLTRIALAGADPNDFRQGAPVQPFVVRGVDDVFTVSVDAAGVPLNRRAWRTDLGVAPLRPTMAAGLLLATGWDGTQPLADPFCGSGTIAIEAALMARGLPPGGDRDFAFARWDSYEPGTWASVSGEAATKAKPSADVTIEAYDRDETAIAATVANAERAGVADNLTSGVQVVSHLGGRSDEGLIATNPPYGKRVGDGDLRALYRRFGAVVRERRPRWGLAVVAADAALARSADGTLKPIGSYGHGGIGVQMFSRQGETESQSQAQ